MNDTKTRIAELELQVKVLNDVFIDQFETLRSYLFEQIRRIDDRISAGKEDLVTYISLADPALGAEIARADAKIREIETADDPEDCRYRHRLVEILGVYCRAIMEKRQREQQWK